MLRLAACFMLLVLLAGCSDPASTPEVIDDQRTSAGTDDTEVGVNLTAAGSLATTTTIVNAYANVYSGGGNCLAFDLGEVLSIAKGTVRASWDSPVPLSLELVFRGDDVRRVSGTSPLEIDLAGATALSNFVHVFLQPNPGSMPNLPIQVDYAFDDYTGRVNLSPRETVCSTPTLT